MINHIEPAVGGKNGDGFHPLILENTTGFLNRADPVLVRDMLSGGLRRVVVLGFGGARSAVFVVFEGFDFVI